MTRTLGAAATVVAMATVASGAEADPPPGASASASASSAATPASVGASNAPLPDLPKLQPISTPSPDPTALRELDRLLERLTADDDRSRTDARAAIADATAAMIPAVHHRLAELRKGIDRDEAARVLEAARKSGRKARKAEGKEGKVTKGDKPRKEHKDDDADDGDWLDFLLASPHPKDAAWRDLVHLFGMIRVCASVGSTPAVREIVQLYAHFGDLVRVDLQRQVAKLRDKAVPALIEARQHDAKSVQKWANKELDVLGRAIPGEAVASGDTQILADVLRAYGRTRDVDAVRVILSFCNSDRVQLREASREALVAVGEPGIWQIRDQYLGLTGDKPPRAWTWDRIARELFGIYDRQRLAETAKLMDDGAAAAGEGKVKQAVEAFDKVLARSPLFERRREMVPSYVARARELEDAQPEDALAMMRKALRLDPNGERAKSIEAEVAYLEGTLSVAHGAPDRTAFERALALDPTHERARRGLAALDDPAAVVRQDNMKRYVGASGIALAAVIALILLGRRRAPPPTPPATPPTDPRGGEPKVAEVP
jgi:tetratricopeptide (TPR) repeat protein